MSSLRGVGLAFFGVLWVTHMTASPVAASSIRSGRSIDPREIGIYLPIQPPGSFVRGFDFGERAILSTKIPRRGQAELHIYLDRLRRRYSGLGFEVAEQSGIKDTPFLLENIDPAWNPRAPFSLPWWQPQDITEPRTIRIAKAGEEIWIWYSASGPEVYFYLKKG
jgi:hypothetical protein